MSAGLTIGSADLADRVLVVAEVGNNHEGDAERAREMVRAVAAAGADAVKFQTFRTEGFVSPSNPDRFNQLKSYELGYETFAELAGLARSLGLLFISTPLDPESGEFLDGIVDAFKIASSDNTFYPLIHQLAGTDKPIVLSTGLADLATVERAVAEIESVRGPGDGRLALLHCVSAYPVPPEAANLAAVAALAERFDYPVGYSDHTIGIEASVLAVALGARIIEKHFTLAAIESDFRDHALSANEEELAALVERVRAAELMRGEPDASPQPIEIEQETALRRSIAARRDLESDHTLERSDLAWLRPGDGLAPGEEDRLLGRRLVRAVAAGELITERDVAE
jgi:N,N'-diacetyllegionaminate synthase